MQAGELNLENRSFNPAIETISVIEMLNEKALKKSILINENLSSNLKNGWLVMTLGLKNIDKLTQ